jgi:site-specific DNA recombinase
MLKDSEAKKIQIVITKSISRFGRDTVDALEALRRLKAAGTRVMFIEENLDTAEDDSEFMISVLESFAQDENEARSQNIRWGMKSRAEQGSSKLYNRKCYGYKQDENDKIVVDEDEAETVRKIFAWYLEGCSILGILKKLEESGIKSPTGKDKWCKRTIDVMLQNEKYRGDVRLHNPLSKETDIMMFDGCPPIVTKEQFQAVQDERTRRSNVICDDNGRRRKSTKFSSKRKDDAGMDLDYIKDGKQMEFAIFCIENTAVREGIDAEAMYELLAVKSDILQSYIVPNYEIFHTQGKDYIVDDILDVMKERGVTV